MMGIPLDGPSWMFGDNKSVITSSTIPHSSLNKRHNALSYHRVREAISANIIYFLHVEGKYNPSDIVTKFLSWSKFWPLIQPLLFWKGETVKDIHPNLPIPQAIKLMSPDPPSELRGVTSPKPVIIINRADLEVISSSDPNLEIREKEVIINPSNKVDKICLQNEPVSECTSGSSSGCQISKNNRNPPERTPSVNLNPLWEKPKVRFLIKSEIIVGTDGLPCLPRNMKNCLKTRHPNKPNKNPWTKDEPSGRNLRALSIVESSTARHVENNPQPEISEISTLSSTESSWTLVKNKRSRDI
jgi:hypothetical protein